MKVSCKVVVVENSKGIAKTHRDALRKGKAPFHLQLARGVRTYKNEFLRYIKKKQKEVIGLLSNKTGELVPKNAEKVLNTFSISGFTSTIFLITKIRLDAYTDIPSVKDLLSEQEFVGP